MTITADSILEIKPGHRLQWEESQGRFVILFPEGMVQLSASAGEILQLCDGEKTVADIIEQLTEKFAGADLTDDVIDFVTEAEDNGWVQLK